MFAVIILQRFLHGKTSVELAHYFQTADGYVFNTADPYRFKAA